MKEPQELFNEGRTAEYVEGYIEGFKTVVAELAAAELISFVATDKAWTLEKDKIEFQRRIKILEEEFNKRTGSDRCLE